MARRRTGGQILVDQLKIHGVRDVFQVPGESFLAAPDAFHDENAIRLVTCRHEAGAAFAAEAYGKLTGQPGVAFVTRGPGACNASIGVHTAFQDSSPMVLLVGQVAREMVDREAFQEVDYRRMFAPLAKWATQIDDPDRVPELIGQAFARAMSGRPGPVVVALPEDMLAEAGDAGDGAPVPLAAPHPAPAEMAALRGRLAAAERPVMVVGGGGWTAGACADLLAFAEVNNLPTMVEFRCQDMVDNAADIYAGDLSVGGNPKLDARLKEADLILAVGARLGEVASGGYTLFEMPLPRQTLVHVHQDATELGRVLTPTVAINAAMAPFAATARALEPVAGGWADWTRTLRADYLAWITPDACPGALDMGVVMQALNDALPDDAITTNDAGNFAAWLQRFYRYRKFRTQLGPGNGAMGYAVPAAVAAKAAAPTRPVVALVGDGGVLMTGNELATALQYGLDPVILVINNGMYGTIRTHQERAYPGRVSGTELRNPDFTAWAASFGAHAEKVATTDAFAPALERALGAGKAAVLELMLDPEALTTRASLSQIRAASEAGRHGS